MDKFSVKDSKVSKLPLGPQVQLSKDQCPSSLEDIEFMGDKPYSQAVGSIMYAMTCTRPDLAHAISCLSRYMANPGNQGYAQIPGRFYKYRIDVQAG